MSARHPSSLPNIENTSLAELLHQLFFRQNNNAWKNRFVVGQKKPRESSGTAFSDSNFEENSKTTAPSKYDGAAKLS